MVGEAAGTTAARGTLPRGLHLAGGLAPPGAVPSPTAVQPPLSPSFPDLVNAGRRPQTSGGATPHHGPFPHLEAKAPIPSTPALPPPPPLLSPSPPPRGPPSLTHPPPHP